MSATGVVHDVVGRDRPADELASTLGPGLQAANGPGSAGCHELMDRASLPSEMAERYLVGHPACAAHPAWHELAERAAAALRELPRQVGAEHLAADGRTGDGGFRPAGRLWRGARAGERAMESLARLAVAALSGAVIAWAATAFAKYALFAIGDYTSEALVEVPPRAFWAVGACGALAGMAAVLRSGRSPLPQWVRPTVVGSMAGVAAVVVPTLGISCALGGSWSKGQAAYKGVASVSGVPAGLVVGAAVGLMRSRRPNVP